MAADPMAPMADPLGGDMLGPAAFQPVGGQVPMGQPMMAQPVGTLDPMAPMATPAGLSPYGHPMAATGVPMAQAVAASGSSAWGSAGEAAAAPLVKAGAQGSGKSKSGSILLLISIAATALLAVGIAMFIALSNNQESAEGSDVAQGTTTTSTGNGNQGTSSNGNRPVPDPPPDLPPTRPDPIPMPDPPPVEPMPPDPPPTDPTRPDPTTPDPTTPDPTTPDPTTPDPGPTTEGAPLSPQELAALKETLVGARQALGARNFTAATQHLADAERLARSQEHKEMLARLKQLDHYVHEFWKAVDQGYTNLQPTSILKIGNNEAAIVEVRPDAMVIRYGGVNKTIKRTQIPSGLAMAIANTWFDSSPTNKVVKGAFLLVDPAGKPEDARRMWLEAEAAGVDVQSLMPVIDEKYEF
jgi:hypothetical protein